MLLPESKWELDDLCAVGGLEADKKLVRMVELGLLVTCPERESKEKGKLHKILQATHKTAYKLNEQNYDRFVC